jgi:hypothetical protein
MLVFVLYTIKCVFVKFNLYLYFIDHMKGLDSHDLYHTVRTKPGLFIYCSGTTKKILTDWPIYSKLAPYLKVLELNHTVKIDFPGGYCSDDNSSKIGFCVTSIPSGHCPGSVM